MTHSAPNGRTADRNPAEDLLHISSLTHPSHHLLAFSRNYGANLGCRAEEGMDISVTPDPNIRTPYEEIRLLLLLCVDLNAVLVDSTFAKGKQTTLGYLYVNHTCLRIRAEGCAGTRR